MAVCVVQPSGVVVDSCEADGVWFDARELDAICAAAAKRKGIRLPAGAAAVGASVLAVAAAGAATAFAVAGTSSSSPSNTENVALDMLMTAPETVYFGVEAVGGAVSDLAGEAAVGGAVEGASDLAGAAVEGAGDVADVAVEAGSGVLDVVTGLLGALFD